MRGQRAARFKESCARGHRTILSATAFAESEICNASEHQVEDKSHIPRTAALERRAWGLTFTTFVYSRICRRSGSTLETGAPSPRSDQSPYIWRTLSFITASIFSRWMCSVYLCVTTSLIPCTVLPPITWQGRVMSQSRGHIAIVMPTVHALSFHRASSS